MKREEVRRIYSDHIARLLADGWTIFPDEMAGSQGEIAHCDLSRDDEIIRVLMAKERQWTHGKYDEAIIITIGKVTEYKASDYCQLGSDWRTIWNNKLAIISTERFWIIGEGPYRHRDYLESDENKVAEMNKKVSIRWRREDEHTRREECGEALKSAAMAWLRKQPGMKTAKLADMKMTRIIRQDGDGHRSFEIEARGKKFYLFR